MKRFLGPWHRCSIAVRNTTRNKDRSPSKDIKRYSRVIQFVACSSSVLVTHCMGECRCSVACACGLAKLQKQISALSWGFNPVSARCCSRPLAHSLVLVSLSVLMNGRLSVQTSQHDTNAFLEPCKCQNDCRALAFYLRET